MATISNLVVEISARTSKLRKGISSASKRLGQFAKRVASFGKQLTKAVAIGAVGAFAALTAAILKTATSLDAVIKNASKFDIEVAQMQELGFIAEQTGVSIQNMSTGIQRMTRRIAEAAQGGGVAAGTLKELGLNAQELVQLDPAQAFFKVAEAMNGIGNQNEKIAKTFKLFDTEGVGLINAFSADIDKLREQFAKLGFAITESQAVAVTAFNDARNRLGLIFKGFFNQLTVQTSSAFTKLIEFVEKSIEEFGGMEKVARAVARGMLNAITSVIGFFGSIQNFVLSIESAFARVRIAASKTTLLFRSLQKGSQDLLGLTGQEDAFGRTIGESVDKSADAAAKSLRAAQKDLNDIFKREADIDNSSFTKGINKLVKDLNQEIEQTKKIELLPELFGETTSQNFTLEKSKSTSKALDEVNSKEKKRKEEIKRWKDELKLANKELDMTKQQMTEVQRQAAATSFGGIVKSLSDVAARSEDDNLSLSGQKKQSQLFNQARLKFAEFSPNQQAKQNSGRIDIAITADQNGIITPVVKSNQLNDKVVNIITDTINEQAKVNDE